MTALVGELVTGPDEEADAEVHRAGLLADRFAASGRAFHIVSPQVMMFSSGEIP